MPKMAFGLNYLNRPCLRIAYDNNLDIMAEPAANAGQFMFDSERAKLGYLYDILAPTYDSRWRTGSGHNDGFRDYWYLTGDTDATQASKDGTGRTVVWKISDSTQTTIFYRDYWPFGYFPLAETRVVSAALPANTFEGATVNYDIFSNSFGYVESYAGYRCTTAQLNFANTADADGYVVNTTNGATQSILSVFQLPAREDALPDFSTTPVSGQNILLINAVQTRLALPGRDTSSSNLDHFIFHEDKIPAKIMRAGDVDIAGNGTVDLVCPFPLTSLTYMDFMIRRQTDAEFWNPPYYDSVSSDRSLKFWYEVKSDRITITNKTSTPVTIRYVIFTDSDQPYTAGGKKSLIMDTAAGYSQIKRPGSSDVAPGLNDIIVDTRLAYLPLLAEGFLNWTSDFPTVISGSGRFKGERMATVNFANPAPKLLPFVKQQIVFPTDASPTVEGSYHKVFTDAGSGTWYARASQNSSWANVHDTSVDFYMAGSNAMAVTSGGSFKNTDPAGSDVDALGMRYYIFGIPQSL
jgi:hypothetical protein